MQGSSWFVAALSGSFVAVCLAAGCGGSSGSGFNNPDGSSGNSSSGSGGGSGGSGGSSGSCGLTGCSSGGSGGSGGSSGGMVACPTGLQCNVSCSGGGSTTITGTVFDPAGLDPLYDIAVYVPATSLQSLPSGVPMGSAACDCGALFQSGAVVSAATGVDGTFKITNAPVGTFSLVAQVGKWRKEISVTTTACQNTAVPNGSLKLPGTLAGAGPNDDMPQIAVSTGGADTLECLMQRIGIPASEYVLGAGGTGHVHIFAGGDSGGSGSSGGHHGGGSGAENPGWPGAPESATNLWDQIGHITPYDITLLSCEGSETYDANPAVLEQYLNEGGRAFASHFHYAWFSGPLSSGQSYSAPADWGNALATWMAGSNGGAGQANGKIVQTLNVGGQPFAKGQALFQWLGLENALGVLGAPPMELPMVPPRYNAVVGPSNKPSQPWVTDDSNGDTMYFSFDTPVNAMPGPDGGAPNYCGRAVFSDLHVSGNTLDPAGMGGPAATCTQRALSPQEKALEFMLFDLSSCVISDQVPPSDAGVPIVQ